MIALVALRLARRIDRDAIKVLCFVSYFGPASFAAIRIEQVHETGAALDKLRTYST